MAINDNTSYELTGAQVKDLASKINAKATNTTFTWDSGSMYDADYNAVTANVVATAFLNGTVSVDDFDDGLVGKIVEYNNYGTYYDEHGTYHDVVAFTVEFTAQNGAVTRKQYLNEPNLAGWIAPRTISISSSTYSDFTGATSSTAGAHGLVPAPTAGDNTKFLKGDGTWDTVPSQTSCVSFYCGALTDSNPVTIYKDSGLTTVATGQDIYDAYTSGSVRIVSSVTISAIETHTISYNVTNYDLTKDSSNVVKGYVIFLSTASTAPHSIKLLKTGTLSDSAIYSVSYANSPTVNDATLTITQNGTSAGTFTANASSNATIALTDTTYSTMTGASSGTAGTSGLVPAPAAGDENKVLSGAGTWVNQSGGGSDSNYFFMLDMVPTSGTAANPTNLRATTGVSTAQYNELVTAITANKNIILVRDLTYHDFYRVEEAIIHPNGYIVLNISSFAVIPFFSLNGEAEITVFDPTYDPTNYPNGAALCVYSEANYLVNGGGTVSSTNLAANAVTTSKIADGAVTASKLDLSGLTPRIIKAGLVNIGSINPNSDSTGSVTIPTQPDTDFIVLFSHQSKGNFYDRVAFTVNAKTTTSFNYVAGNNHSSGTATNIVMGYAVVKYS